MRHTELRPLSETDDAEGGARLAFGGLNTMLYVWQAGPDIVAFRFSFYWRGLDVCLSWDIERPEQVDWDAASSGDTPRGTPFLEPLREKPPVSVAELFWQLSGKVPEEVRAFVLERLRSLT